MVDIGNIHIKAKVDSGSDENFITKSLFDKLPRLIRKKFNSRNSICRCANGASIKIYGTITIPFYMQGQKVITQFKVLEKGTSDMFLGQTFLRTHQATLSFSKTTDNSMTLLLNTAVHSGEYIKIPPHTEVLVMGYTKAYIEEGTDGYLYPFESLYTKGIMAAHLVATCKSGKLPTRLYNSCAYSVNINKGERIASFQICSGADELLPYDVTGDLCASINTNLDAETAHKDDRVTPEMESSHLDFNVKDHHNLSDSEKGKLLELIHKYSDVFVCPPDNKIGLTDLTECRIDTVPGAVPVCKYPYRLAPKMRDIMTDIIEGQERDNLIEKTDEGPWASPALLVKKSNGTFRLVIDYRELNAATIPQKLKIPRIEEIFDTIGEKQPKFFTVLDCTQGFHQVPLHTDSRDKTAFITPIGKYRYKTMPQGMRNSPAVFQSLMDRVLRGIQFKYAMVYIDDLCIFSATFEEHLVHIEDVFTRLKAAKLKLHPKKCKFAVDKVHYLGHVLTPHGIQPNPEKVEAIENYPIPTKVKQVRAFMGMLGYYRKFIRDFGIIARPLYDLTKKDVKFKWSEECNTAFLTLKKKMISSEVLSFPNFNKKFYLATDASQIAIGACLFQEVEGKFRPVGFAGRGLSKAEKGYCVTEQEGLAVVWAVQHFRVYLEGVEFEVHTDHSALTQLLHNNPQHQGRLLRWYVFLQQFPMMKIKHIKGKNNVVPDALSRRPYGVNYTAADRVLDSFLELDSVDTLTDITSKQSPDKTSVNFNDEVQIIPRNILKAHNPLGRNIHDNQNTPMLGALNVQAIGNINKRRERLRPIIAPRARVNIENVPDLSAESIKKEQDNDLTCRAILNYLNNQILPINKEDARLVLLKQADMIVEEGILFHIYCPTGNKPSATAQLVVPQNLKYHFLKIYHDGDLGAHFGYEKVLKAMREKYYWDNMARDIKEYVSTCDVCQAIKSASQAIVSPLALREQAPAPFDTLVMDTVGPLTKSYGCLHLVCFTDQYSKFIIAWPTKSITAKAIALKFHEKIICVFGAPRRLVSDRGSGFKAQLFEALCKRYKIKQSLSSAYHPQTQGQVERAQQTLITSLRGYINEKHTDWAYYLPSMVWAHNTTESQATGLSPYTLVFGRTPVSPADIGIPDPFYHRSKTQMEHFAQIMSRQEVAHDYAIRMQAQYSAKMKERFDRSKATDISLKPGDIVWIHQSTYRIRKTKKKMRRKFHGPFCIVEFVNRHTVKLRNMTTGRCLPTPVNIARLKRGRIRQEHNNWDPNEVEPNANEVDDNELHPSSSSEGSGSDSDTEDNTQQSQSTIAPTPDQPQALASTNDTPTLTLTQQRRDSIRSEPTIAFNTRAQSKANKVTNINIHSNNNVSTNATNKTPPKSTSSKIPVISPKMNETPTARKVPTKTTPSVATRKSPRLLEKNIPKWNKDF